MLAYLHHVIWVVIMNRLDGYRKQVGLVLNCGRMLI